MFSSDNKFGENMKNILILGKNSYIGNSISKYLMKTPDKYRVESISIRDNIWKDLDLSRYNVIIHLAAIVHQKEKSVLRELYFRVNRDLPIEIADRAKNAGVSQFIFFSTMAVYGEEGEIDSEVIVSKETKLNPKSLYAKSKLEAEVQIRKMNDDIFKVVVLRPPMIYGENSSGNYKSLEKFANITPIFPMIYNQRSMLNIEKLCQYISEYIDTNAEGLFLPQDEEYITTSLMIKEIAEKNGRTIHLSPFLGLLIRAFGRKIKIIRKIFGNLTYER